MDYLLLVLFNLLSLTALTNAACTTSILSVLNTCMSSVQNNNDPCAIYPKFVECTSTPDFQQNCLNDPTYIASKQNFEQLQAQCGGAGGAGTGGAGDAGGAGGDAGGTCDINIIKPCTDILSSMMGDTGEATGENVQKLCQKFKEFGACVANLPPDCQQSPIVLQMKAQEQTMASSCQGDCALSEIMICIEPLKDLNLETMKGLPTSTTLTDMCGKFATLQACLQPKLPACKGNPNYEQLMGNMKIAENLGDFLCKENFQVIMDNKDCFDNSVIKTQTEVCTTNFSITIDDRMMKSNDERCAMVMKERKCLENANKNNICSQDAIDSMTSIFYKANVMMSKSAGKELTCDIGAGNMILPSILTLLSALLLKFFIF